MENKKKVTKSSSPLRQQTLKANLAEIADTAPEVLPLTDDAVEPKGCTQETLEVLSTFDEYDFVRVCALPIVDLGISNPAETWASDYNDLAKRLRSEVVDEKGRVRDCWVKVCNKMQKCTPIMTPELLAVSVCKIAGWKAFMRDVHGKVD